MGLSRGPLRSKLHKAAAIVVPIARRDGARQETNDMNKTLWMTMAAFAVVGVASTALPSASACWVAGHDYVHQTINYVCGGEAVNDGLSTGRFVLGETFETIEFVENTYGDD